MSKSVYIVVGKRVVSVSGGTPRVFTRQAARNFIRNHSVILEGARVVESIVDYRRRVVIND